MTLSETLSARDKLIHATLVCLRTLGQADATVKRIAEEAGVNHGLVHHYFGSKEQLLVEALRQLDTDLMRSIGPLKERLHERPHGAVQDVFLPKVAFNEDLLKVVMEFFAMAPRMPLVAEELRKFIALRHQLLRQVLHLRDHVSAALFFAGIFGLAMHHQVEPDLPIADAAERLLQLILQDSGHPAPPPTD